METISGWQSHKDTKHQALEEVEGATEVVSEESQANRRQDCSSLTAHDCSLHTDKNAVTRKLRNEVH